MTDTSAFRPSSKNSQNSILFRRKRGGQYMLKVPLSIVRARCGATILNWVGGEKGRPIPFMGYFACGAKMCL
jgi:hypothetical protein